MLKLARFNDMTLCYFMYYCLYIYIYIYIYIYLDKGPQGLGVRLAIWGHSTLPLFTTLWALGAFGDPQLYSYLLYFSHLGYQRDPEVVQRGP